jgi:hypothetical protein
MKIIPCIKPANKAAVLLITLASLCLCSGCGRKKIDTGQWYDYGNGLVNLNKVSLLKGEFHALFIDDGGKLERTQIEAFIKRMDKNMEYAKAESGGDYKFSDSLRCTIDFHPVFTLELVDEHYDDYDEFVDALEDALEKYEDLVAQLDAIKL